MSSLLFVFKILSTIRLSILSITSFYLLQGIFHRPIPILSSLLSLTLIMCTIHILTEHIRLKLFKEPKICTTMFSTFFWIFFIKLSNLEIFMIDNFYQIQSLICSATIFIVGIYLYQNCQAVFNIFTKIKISSRLLIILSFLIVIVIGTVLLMLPIAMQSTNQKISAVDAFFTAVSAVCVTGLTVVDISTYFSRFGQIVIITLIQIGALGLVTITTVFLTLLGRKLSLTGQMSAKDNSNSTLGNQNLTKFLGFTLGFTVIVELLLACVMFIRFIKILPIWDAVFYSIFHAISAFCNAGFSLFSNSLITFRGDWLINFSIMSAIIIGGMGFSVWQDTYRRFYTKETKQLQLQSVIAFRMSFLLVVVGAVLFYLTERYYTLEHLNFKEQMLSSFFASVNLRTAGFNTVDLSKTSETSRLFSLLLMYIGASPGSTGGGIKTTSFLVIYSAFKAAMKNDPSITIFGKRIDDSLIPQTWALVFNSLAWIFIVAFLISYIEHLPLSDILYETFSAYATVGVSVGITGSLSSISKILLAVTMILGRVGPTTIMLALMGKYVQKSLIRTPPSHISIG